MTRDRYSAERLERFIGSMDEIVFEFDGDGRYLNVWSENDNLLKRPRPELLGRRFDEVVPEELAEKIHAAFRRIRTTGRPESLEYSLTVQGGLRWFLARLAVVPSPGGGEPTFSFLARDVTEQRKLRERMENYLHMLAHDLRSPLTVVSGHVQILREMLQKNGLGEKLQLHVQSILGATDQMRQMMEDLVEVGRLESGQIVLHHDLIHLQDFVDDFLGRLQVSEDYRRIRVKIRTGLPPIRIGVHHLERFLGNLVSNALKYSGPDQPVEIEAARAEGQVCLAVQDYGQGIAPEDLPHIFDRFYRTPSARCLANGTGMGLYITKSLLEAYGGSIQVESEPGCGTRFIIRLPEGTC